MSDPPRSSRVEARHVLDALHELERRGHTRVLESLEESHPDLADHVLESLTNLHGQAVRLGGRARQTRTVMDQAQGLVLSVILACFAAEDQDDT